MNLTKKNNLRVNIVNLVLSLLMVVPIVYCIFKLKNDFIFSDFIAALYSTIFHFMMIIIIYTSIRQLSPPEWMEFLENTYVQLVGFILTNLLLIDTSLVGTIVGSIIIFLVLGESIYVYKYL